MTVVNDWRKVINLPIIQEESTSWGVKELEDLLIDSIKSCSFKNFKDNRGEIHTTISGGLDSSLCLAIVRKVMGENCPIYTYTIGHSENYSDIIFARKISNFFESIHREFIPSAEEITDVKKRIKESFSDYKEGNETVFLMYEFIASFIPHSVIVHDGIDELLGGYWKHRSPKSTNKREEAFIDFWTRLEKEHLLPLEKSASRFEISLIFPYLQESLVDYVSKIPVDRRTSHDESKIFLRRIAEKYLPKEIIKRKKIGFSEALNIKKHKRGEKNERKEIKTCD